MYLKFHKVGSATVARTIRCLSYAEPRLVPDAWRSPRTVTHAARPGGDARCGASAWEHDVVLLYRREGVAGVRACLAAGFAPRLVTVLRDPAERVLSAIYFFLGGDGPGGPERAEARFRKYGGREPAPLAAEDLEAIVSGNKLWREGGLHEYLQGLAAERGGAGGGADGGGARRRRRRRAARLRAVQRVARLLRRRARAREARRCATTSRSSA